MIGWLNKKPLFVLPRGYPEAAVRCFPFPRYWFFIYVAVNQVDLPIPDRIELKAIVLGAHLVVSVVFVSVIFVEFVRFLGLYKRIKKDGSLFCTRCVYDMSALPDADLCPECGKPWYKDVATKEWGVFLGKNRKK